MALGSHVYMILLGGGEVVAGRSAHATGVPGVGVRTMQATVVDQEARLMANLEEPEGKRDRMRLPYKMHGQRIVRLPRRNHATTVAKK